MLEWLASRGVYANTNYANFGPGTVNNGNANSNNNYFNSNGNSNNNSFALRAVASINCGYAVICCIRDNIETDICPLVIYYYKQKIDKYIC